MPGWLTRYRSGPVRAWLLAALSGVLALVLLAGGYLNVPGLRGRGTAHADGIAITDGSCGTTPYVQFADANGQPILWLEVAVTEAQKELGLMNRPYMDPDAGMVFLFDPPSHVGFWMHNTILPLSIAWMSLDGTIVDIQEMQAETDDVHFPSAFYSYAVEANQGWYASNGVVPGEHATFCLPPGATQG